MTTKTIKVESSEYGFGGELTALIVLSRYDDTKPPRPDTDSVCVYTRPT